MFGQNRFASLTPLHNIIYHNMVGSAITQIQYINDGGPTGFSPLMYAASLCVDNEEMMKELIMLGADVNASNSVEEMVLMFTLLRGKSWSVINLMLEHGLDVNKTMHFKLSLLNIVGVEYLQGLINVGANINHVDIWGQSVLYSYVMNRKVENVRILLENGADLNLKTNNGRTPLKCALDLEMDFAKRNEMIRLLLQYGGNYEEIEKKDSHLICQYALIWLTQVLPNELVRLLSTYL